MISINYVYVIWCQIFLTLLLIEDILPQNSLTLKVVGSWDMGISMSWYSRNSSLTLSCSSGPWKGRSSWNLKREPCVKNWLRICFVTMVKIELKVFNMLKSWKMWNPCLSAKYRASSHPTLSPLLHVNEFSMLQKGLLQGEFVDSVLHSPDQKRPPEVWCLQPQAACWW